MSVKTQKLYSHQVQQINQHWLQWNNRNTY